MMFRNLLKKIGIFFLSLVFGLLTFVFVPSMQVHADPISWTLDILSGGALDELFVGYDLVPVLFSGGTLDLSKFSSYDEFISWWRSDMSHRVAKPSAIQETFQAGIDAYRVAGSAALDSEDSLLAKVNQRYLAMQIGYAKNFVDDVSVLADAVEPYPVIESLQPLLNKISSMKVGVHNSNDLNPCYWISGPGSDMSVHTSSSIICVTSDFNQGATTSSPYWYNVYYVGSGSIFLRVRDDETCYIENLYGFDPSFKGLAGSANYVYQLGYKSTYGTGHYSNPSSVSSLPSIQTEFAGISTAINYICSHFRRTSVYVNGTPWVVASNNSYTAPSDTLSFDGVVRADDGDLAYNVTVPDTVDGSAFVDIVGMLSRIYDIINSNAATKTLTLDDVKDLVTDEDGEEAALKTVIVDTVISDTLTNTISPSPFPDPDFEHPFLVYNSSVTGSSTSILAELIHSTDVVLPDELMLALWGAIGALFFLGIIHILHK